MVNLQLLEYVSAQLAAGISEDQLVKVLTEVGWPQVEIDTVLSETKSPKPVVGMNPVSAETPINPQTVKTGFVYGDGSMVNAFDLGLPAAGQVSQPQTKSPESVTKSDTPVLPEVAPVQLDKPTEPVVEIKPTRGTAGKKVFLVALVFLVLSLVGVGIWWIFLGGNDNNQDLTQSITSPFPTQAVLIEPTSEPASISGQMSGIVLGQEEFVSNKGFVITPPKGWNKDESGVFGVLVTFSNPKIDKEQGNEFAANINVVTEGSQGVSLSRYVASAQESLINKYPSYTELSRRELTIGDKEAVLIEATYEVGAYSLHNFQLIVAKEASFFQVTGAALNSKWAEYKEVLELSLLSFR